uniref:Uncharacterized protein n=1 Tax=Glycine max TaxID=3847 RepID=C6T3T7_SOYBN|nr:unknown [Glycine max]
MAFCKYETNIFQWELDNLSCAPLYLALFILVTFDLKLFLGFLMSEFDQQKVVYSGSCL